MAEYVTVAEVRDALGVQSLYSDADIESVCEASTDLIQKQLWFNEYPVVGVSIYGNIATAVLSAPLPIATGQDVVITGCGGDYNGNHTVTGTYPFTNGSLSFNFYGFLPYTRYNFPAGYSMIQWSVTHADDNYHLIVPYGKVAVTPTTGVDYADEPLVRQAALMIAIDIWQARQQSNAGGVSPDFSPSPYRMGNSLLSRVRGLLAPYLSPRGMVG